LPHATLEFSGAQKASKLAEPSGNLKAAGARRIQLLYIVSASYSGSTLLTFLLAANPRLATVGELKATSMGDVEEYPCSCGARIRACDFWRRVAAQLAERGSDFDVSRFGTHFRLRKADSLAGRLLGAEVRGSLFEGARRLLLRALPGLAGEFRAILERNRLLVDAICELRGARVFLDGSKEPHRLKYLLNSGFWDVKAVYLVRDGRGRTSSTLRRRLARRPVPDRLRVVRRAAARWRQVNESCQRVLAGLPPEAWVRIRYEDLCRDPNATLAPVLALVGEPPIEIPEDFRSIDHHILGNVMRLRSGSIALDEKWRTDLNDAELAAFDEVAGDMNRSMGYL
jgi:hypothetical protein